MDGHSEYSNIYSIEEKKPDGEVEYQEISRFVTELWEHPLVDQDTKKHRDDFARTSASFFEKYDINPEDAVIIPVGSTLGIATNHSDFDCIMVFQDGVEIPEKLQPNVAVREEVEKVQVVGSIMTESDVMEYSMGNAQTMVFLITPDDYIFGNKDLAARMRIKVAKESTDQQIVDYLEKNVKDRFDVDRLTNQRDKRVRRMDKNLELRSNQAKMPGETYKTAFKEAVRGFKPPNMSIFRKGLECSEGKLTIDSSYVATGTENMSLKEKLKRKFYKI
jgi:hypothetical protein